MLIDNNIPAIITSSCRGPEPPCWSLLLEQFINLGIAQTAVVWNEQDSKDDHYGTEGKEEKADSIDSKPRWSIDKHIWQGRAETGRKNISECAC